MGNLQRFSFDGTLPDNFFQWVPELYRQHGLPFDEDPEIVRSIFKLESDRNEIIIYTNGQSVRLVGVFPYDSEEAHFGFWESENDELLNKEAFSLLEADTKSKGNTRLTGPLNFNTFHRYRLRLGAIPSWKIFDNEPVNPTYYEVLLTQCGYTEERVFESRLIRKDNIPDIFSDKKMLLEELHKIPYDFIPVNPETWVQYEDEIYILVDKIFSQNPSYRSVSREQFQVLYNTAYAAKLCPHSSVLFRDRASGRLAAMSFCYPNYKPLHLPVSVKPTFEQHYHLLKKPVLLAKSVGVHPDFRQQGLMNYLGAYGMLNFRELYEEVIFCLMRSDNFSTHFTNMVPYESARYAFFGMSLA